MTLSNRLLAAALVGTAALILSGFTLAQQPSSAERTASAQTEKLVSLDEIESRLRSEGIRVHELQLRGSVVEVEGRDASNREIEVVVDRRTGKELSRRFD
jgi:preprotein translocase subunit SecD